MSDLEDVLIFGVNRAPFPGETDGSVERKCRTLLLAEMERQNRVPLDGAVKVSWHDPDPGVQRPMRVCRAEAWGVPR